MINTEELSLLCGLPHIQQLAYLRAIRPYMDLQTSLVGVKRGISYQSIAEQLYVEPHQGTKAQSFSRDQVRRAIAGLARAGLLSVQSEGMQLILKCELATAHYCVQNKAAINPPQEAATNPPEKVLASTGLSALETSKADIATHPKAATPLKNNYLYFLFEKFWSLYPEKKSQERAWQALQQLNPNESLGNQIIAALTAQINHREAQLQQGNWVPPWKYPANWLMNQCWNDELAMDSKEKPHAARRTNTRNNAEKEWFWIPEAEPTDAEGRTDNVISFSRYQQAQ